MLDCSDYERLIARFVDEPAAIADGDRVRLETHLASCASCRTALDDQRNVSNALAMRPPSALPHGFQRRVAARLDAENSWLPVANWRAWTAGLAPLAAALLLAAWLTPGQDATSTTTAPTTAQAASTSFDTWAASNVRSPTAAVFLQPGTTGDSLLEVVLTNNTAAAGAGSDVR